jgi:hypothetical protein
MMGQGKLDVTLRMNLADKRNSFTFTAQMGPVDLTVINPMLSNLAPAKVVSGKLKRLLIPLVTANSEAATGKMLFYYNDLVVSLTDEKQTTWTKVKTGVINFAANNLILSNDNPAKNGKMKTGVIFAERKKELGFVNYFWRCAFSGLKSTMGFNSKAQKSLIREEKKTGIFKVGKEKPKEHLKEAKNEKKKRK